MALLKQNIPISFVEGVDTKSDRKQVLVGRFLQLENAILQTPGELRKRNGYMALPPTITTGGSISTGVGAASFKDELLEFDGISLYSFSESFQQWVDKGKTTSLELDLFPVIRNTFQQTVPDMAEHTSGLQLFTWEDSRGGSRYSIIDSVTGQAIVQDAIIASTAIKPKAMTVGNYLIIFYVDSVSHHLRYISIPVTAPLSPASAVDFAIDLNVSNPNYDVVFYSSKLYVAYNTSAGGGSIALRFLNNFLIISSERQITGENADGCIAVFVDTVAMQLTVAYYNGTEVKYFVILSTLPATQIVPPTIIETVADVVRIVGEMSSGSGSVWYEISAVSSINELIRTASINNSGTVGTPAVFLRSVGLAGKPFFYSNLYYIPCTFESVEQSTYFYVTQNGDIIGKGVPTNGGGLLTRNVIPETVQLSSGIITVAALQKDLLTTIGGSVFTQTGVVEFTLDFTAVNTFYRAEMANNLHISGGILEMYDGVNVVEHGFNIFPEDITFTQATGGSLSPGQYQFEVTYEWTDNQGQIHRSAPSLPVTVTVTGGTDDKVTLTIPTLRLTQKSGVRIVIYRTEANGTIFYQDSSTTSPVLNDKTVDTVTFDSTQADSVLIGNPIIYTTGGVLENIASPAPLLLTQFKDRLIVVPSENPFSFWPSQSIVPGTPVSFSDVTIQNIDQRGGPATAVEQMDDKLIIFKRNTVFYVIGDGPDNTGAQNTFTEAQLVTTDSGCINARSVVIMPAGLMYQSAKGIYLLDRSLGVSYIGAPVEAFNNDTVLAALLIPSTTRVRFLLDTGFALEYDYFVKQWSIFTNHAGQDATLFQNLFTYVKSNGLMYQEAPGTFTDNGEFIKLKAVTSWLSMATLQGFQRCYRALFLGEYISPHTLLIQTAYDFNPTFTQQDYINAGSLFNLTTYGQDSPYGGGSPYGGAYPSYQWRVDLERQKCQAIQFSIEDVQSSNFGEGMSLSALNLMVGAKKGSNKIVQPQIFS